MPRDENRLFQAINRRILPPLFAAYLLNSIDRANISFASLRILHHYRLSGADFGWIGGIFFIGYVLFQVPASILALRVGLRPFLGIIMVAWGLFSALMCCVDSKLGFYTCRFLLGVCEAGFAPCCFHYLSCWYPPHRITRALTFQQISAPLAAVIGGPLSGAIMSGMDGVWGQAGWRWMFLLEGLPAVVLGVIVMATLPENPESAQWLTPEERQALAAHHDAPVVRGGRVSARALAIPAVFYFSLITGMYAVNLWLPQIIAAHDGVGLMATGWLYAVPYAAAMIAMLLFTHSHERMRCGAWGLAAALALACSTTAGAGLAIQMASLACAMAALYVAYTMFWAATINQGRSGPGAVAFAAVNAFGLLGGVTGPVIVGHLKDMTGTTGTGLRAIALLIVLTALLYALLRPGARRATFSPQEPSPS
ncbi:MFS transporter [Acetobacter sp. TBRC 12305]|uniref:MFS transporter n=1 Tax=Acetobacter garciniae TaxID=2817435 RepID=A0A939KQ34_9PROT|nr:MFS transporter [Acetobacter garciniae]MBO1324804.1 MFS transporter [Acetobacter garciniae]MBX0344495.1 MFS transporter [Acetobacter garciniae]